MTKPRATNEQVQELIEATESLKERLTAKNKKTAADDAKSDFEEKLRDIIENSGHAEVE